MLRLLVSKLTTCVTSQALKWENIFFLWRFFSHWARADSSFMRASDVSCLQMYRANILFGAPNQGQMLDVWESQTAESALRCTCHSMPRGHQLSLGSMSWIPQDTPIGIHANILDHTYWNPWKIRLRDRPVRRTSYSTWLCSELAWDTPPQD